MKTLKEKFPLIALIITFFGIWLYAIENRELHNESDIQSISTNLNSSSFSEAHADEIEEHSDKHESLDEVLAELLTKHNKESIQELNCDDLSEEELERVGDAVMETMHPGGQHERMDEMMGGEGSESLRLMHHQMGESYLGCRESSTSDNYGMGGPMMMLGGSMMGGDSMMMGSSMGQQFGTGGFGFLGGIFPLLGIATWILFIAFLIAGIRWFWKKGDK
jgi:hypothetical protein